MKIPLILSLLFSLAYAECTPCFPAAIPFDDFYLGVHVGALCYTGSVTDKDSFLVRHATYTASVIHPTGGVHLGCDWRLGTALFGLVGDGDWTRAQTSTRLLTRLPEIHFSFEYQLRWFSTIRARAGLVVCNTLFYFTGGVVAGRFKNTIINNMEGIVNFQQSFSRTLWGWTGGIGVEFLFRKHWSLNAEMLFFHFDQHGDAFQFDSLLFDFDFNHSACTGRIGINYRFGSW